MAHMCSKQTLLFAIFHMQFCKLGYFPTLPNVNAKYNKCTLYSFKHIHKENNIVFPYSKIKSRIVYHKSHNSQNGSKILKVKGKGRFK